MAALLRIIARHPVLVFMVIGLGAGFLTAAIRPIADAEVLPFGLPLHGFVGGLLGVGVGAFVVTAALAGREALLILLGAVCAGVSRSVGIWSYCSPFRSELRSFRSPSMAPERWRHLPVVGRGRWPRWSPSFCCSWCCFSWPRRSVSPGSFSTHARTAITP
jgi:hypothetical protein